jgi:hypothetical protein
MNTIDVSLLAYFAIRETRYRIGLYIKFNVETYTVFIKYFIYFFVIVEILFDI